MREVLKGVRKILERYNCKWWLEAGTCLGAVREKDFISYDKDLDIGLPSEHLNLWDIFIKDFLAAGFKLYKEWLYDGKRIELSFTLNGKKADLFFFFERKNKWWMGAFGPDEKGRWGDNVIFLPHVFSKELFYSLKEISFAGMKCYIPNPPEQYLLERYGKNWRIPDPDYQYWKSCAAIDRNFFKEERIVFIGGVWDLFHVGHLNILERSKELGEILIVGILTDNATARYKSKPLIPFEQRKMIIESLRSVDRVIKQNDTDPTEDLKGLKIVPHYLIHGDDWNSCPGEDYVKEHGGKLILLPYTKGVSSSDLKKKIEGEE